MRHLCGCGDASWLQLDRWFVGVESEYLVVCKVVLRLGGSLSLCSISILLKQFQRRVVVPTSENGQYQGFKAQKMKKKRVLGTAVYLNSPPPQICYKA